MSSCSRQVQKCGKISDTLNSHRLQDKCVQSEEIIVFGTMANWIYETLNLLNLKNFVLQILNSNFFHYEELS